MSVCDLTDANPMTKLEHETALALINELAPCTRRDEWWSTDSPYEIIAKHLRDAKA